MKTHQTHIHQLDHGSSLLFIDVPNARSAYMTINIHSGQRHALAIDRQHYPVPHLLEHMVFDGSKQYPTLEKLSRAIKRDGTYSNGTTNNYYNTYDFRFTPSRLEYITPIAFDMIYRPLLTEQSFEEEREVITREAEEQMGDYDAVTYIHTDEQIVPESIVNFHEQLELIDSVTHTLVKKYHKKFYTAANTQFILAADKNRVDIRAFVKQLNTELADIPKGKKKNINKLPVKKPLAPAVPISTPLDIDTITTVLTFVIEGESDNETFHKLAMFSGIIAGDNDYSLFNKLRKTGDLYSMQFFPSKSKETTEVSCGFTVNKDRYLTVLAHVLYELRNYTANGISDEAFEEASSYDRGTLLLTAETPSDYADWYGGSFLMNEPFESPEQIADAIKTVPQSEVLKLMDSLIKDENLYISIMGGASQELVEPTQKVRELAFATPLSQPVTVLDEEVRQLYKAVNVPRAPILGTVLRLLLLSMVVSCFLPSLYDKSGELLSLWSLGLKESFVINSYIVLMAVCVFFAMLAPIRRVLSEIGYVSAVMFGIILLSYVLYIDVDKDLPNTFATVFSSFGLIIAPVLILLITANSMAKSIVEYFQRRKDKRATSVS